MSTSGNRLHYSVIRNFWVRFGSYVLVIVITLTNVWPEQRSTTFVAVLAPILLLWSFASFALAARARDSRAAEIRILIGSTFTIHLPADVGAVIGTTGQLLTSGP